MLAQAHGCPGSVREAAPRWYSTRTPVTARRNHMTPARRPSLAATTEWARESVGARYVKSRLRSGEAGGEQASVGIPSVASRTLTWRHCRHTERSSAAHSARPDRMSPGTGAVPRCRGLKEKEKRMATFVLM